MMLATLTNVTVQILLVLIVTLTRTYAVQPLNQQQFPLDFDFGVATSAYQVEGAWNASGKGVNIWDTFTHNHPDKIYDGSTGDVACDSYHKVPEDVELLQKSGVRNYRFSLSWSRILPTGYLNNINPDGINYYSNLIDRLLAKGIRPLVTIFHWDLPQPLQDLGGWPNPDLADYFVDFADLVFKKFGDRVKNWITFNEIKQICKLSYGDGILAPGLTSAGIGDYKCVATVLKAHARSYDLYKRKYKSYQKGKVGFTVDSFWFQPASNSSADVAAADRLFDFYTGFFTNPIYGSGDFPHVVKQFVAERSKQQGFPTSRLPTLSKDEVNLIRGSSDFFGLNYYTAIIVQDVPAYPLSVVSWDTDARVNGYYDPSWPGSASPWLKVVPWSLKLALKDLKRRYGNIPIIITENGFSDTGGLEDYDRSNFLLGYLSSALDAIYDNNVNLIGYFHWALLDNFEWVAGYTQKFGLNQVNFTDPNRRRTPKLSSTVYSLIIRTRRLPLVTIPHGNLQDVPVK